MVIKEMVREILLDSIEGLFGVKTDFIPVNYPEFKKFGDYSTPVTMSLAKILGKKPRDLAVAIVDAISGDKRYEGIFDKIEIAGAGFVNFFLSKGFLEHETQAILKTEFYGKNDSLRGKKILLEFVSANPTGPLHIGHGRWAAIGASMASILKHCGATVATEFYVNDAGNQIELLYRSVEAVKKGEAVPENGYHGAYIKEVAESGADPVQILLQSQKDTLSQFRVFFDRYFSERENLHQTGYVQETIEAVKRLGYTYESEGALWFRTTDFGDDKDRVLIKADGALTYFAVDIAYHRNKILRDQGHAFTDLINVLGADHHGYVKRLEAAVKVFGKESESDVALQIIIGQLVNLFRDGEPVRMSKRTGEMITLQEVMDEIGIDATRYFMVMRKADTALDFDIETAKKKSDDNPVFYIQYAHARICSIFAKAGTNTLAEDLTDTMDSEEARDLMLELLKFPEMLIECAKNLEPHRIPLYLENLAGVFHRYYNHHRVITDDQVLTQKRLYLVKTVACVIRMGLELIGVKAPESM